MLTMVIMMMVVGCVDDDGDYDYDGGDGNDGGGCDGEGDGECGECDPSVFGAHGVHARACNKGSP